jgi:hypothetical protein
MGVSQIRRAAARRASGARKHAAARAAKPARKPGKLGAKPGGKAAAVPVPPVMYRFCKSGWAVLVEKQPSQQGTRFVCPFCTLSHRVSGPVRGFRKLRRAQWIKLRRVDE